MAFQLDTSGNVSLTLVQGVPYEIAGGHEWSDLSPFTQGYIEALFDDYGPIWIQGDDYDGLYWVPRFSDLAPETLDRIIADCEAKATALACPLTAEDGRVFWRKFMSRSLTVQLCDDGKVRFAS